MLLLLLLLLLLGVMVVGVKELGTVRVLLRLRRKTGSCNSSYNNSSKTPRPQLLASAALRSWQSSRLWMRSAILRKWRNRWQPKSWLTAWRQRSTPPRPRRPHLGRLMETMVQQQEKQQQQQWVRKQEETLGIGSEKRASWQKFEHRRPRGLPASLCS
jgi:hypothetical protein